MAHRTSIGEGLRCNRLDFIFVTLSVYCCRNVADLQSVLGLRRSELLEYAILRGRENQQTEPETDARPSSGGLSFGSLFGLGGTSSSSGNKSKEGGGSLTPPRITTSRSSGGGGILHDFIFFQFTDLCIWFRFIRCHQCGARSPPSGSYVLP